MEFDDFYRRYYADVRRHAARTFGEDDADDIAQETMLRAYDRFDRLSDGRPVWTWLTTVADNVGRDRIRRTRRVVADSVAVARDEPAIGDESARVAIAVDVRPLLGRALRRLTERDRHVLAMHEVGGVAIGEIAAASGVTANAMRQRLFRARRTLRQYYVELGGREYAIPLLGSPDVSRPGPRRAVAATVAMVVAAVAPTGVRPTPATAGPPVAAQRRPAVVAPARAVEPSSPAVALPVVTAPRALLDRVRRVTASVTDRVEAESGVFDPLCGDTPMAAFTHPTASAGVALYYTGSGCHATYVAAKQTTVTSIRVMVAGRNGLICGRFDITGDVVGESERFCGAAGSWLLVPVATTIGTGTYTITWTVTDGGEDWLDVVVDHHGVAPAVSRCRNGVDDDGDGAADERDTACHDVLDDDEASLGACDDGIDNDGDGATDFGSDTGCGTWADATENCAVNGTKPEAFTEAATCWATDPDEVVVPPLP